MATVKTYGNYRGVIIRYIEGSSPDGGTLELIEPETGLVNFRSYDHGRFWAAVKEGKAEVDAMWA